MSAKLPAKSILKQPTRRVTAVTNEQKAQVEKDRKNLQIALKHAYLIQHRKDVEAAILDSITTLIDLPAAVNHTSKEAVTFINLIKPFQPSDYDSLIEERRVDGRCGYVLCANQPRSKSIGKSATWKLSEGMADWCSDECAKKGLYVKAQLSEVPAWERVPEQQPNVHLHEDDHQAEDGSAVRHANRTACVDEWRQKVANDKGLASERGENITSLRPNQVMSGVIVERQPRPFKPSNAEAGIGHYASIEGYQPRHSGKAQKLEDDSEDEQDDNG